MCGKECDGGCSPKNLCKRKCDPCCGQHKIYYCGEDISCVGVERGEDIHDVISVLGEKVCQILDGQSTNPYINIDNATEIQCPSGGYVIQAVDPSTGNVVEQAIICNGTDEEWVESVTGNIVDNTDPQNPVVNVYADGVTIIGTGTEEDPFVAVGGDCDCNPVLFSKQEWTTSSDSILSDYDFTMTESMLPQKGDYALIRIEFQITSQPSFTGELYLDLESTSTTQSMLIGLNDGIFTAEVLVKRNDMVSNVPTLSPYIFTKSTIQTSGSAPLLSYLADAVPLPTDIKFRLSTLSGSGKLKINDYTVTQFKQP